MEAATHATGALSKPLLVVTWVAQIIAAVILAQTLFFKFTGSEESRYIFETLGVEPWGRILAGVTELVAVVLLLVPGTAVWGAALATMVILGAIGAHLTRLGLVVKDDGGLLFGLAVTTLVCAVTVLIVRRGEILRLIGPRLGLGGDS